MEFGTGLEQDRIEHRKSGHNYRFCHSPFLNQFPSRPFQFCLTYFYCTSFLDDSLISKLIIDKEDF